MTHPLTEAIARAMRETADELLSWARSPENNGPFSEEAFRTYVHIAASLERLSRRFDAMIQAAEGERG